jgi:hypothetical protein
MESKRCLVLMPIGVSRRPDSPTFVAVYQHLIVPALQATGFPLAIFRGDEVMRSGMSLHEGRLWLQEPHVVLADLTARHSGVLHDLTLRPGLSPRTLLLSQEAAAIPPRFRAYRRILYGFTADGMARFHQDVKRHVGEILALTTAAASAADPGAHT